MAPRDDSGVYHFGEFRLDPASGAVLGPDGAELRLRPKAYAMLRHLLDNPGRLLGREELLDALWPGVIVSDDSLTQCIVDLRHALGGRAADVLKTVPKRGYVLIAEVRRDEPLRSDARPGAGPEPASALAPATAPPHGASLREDPVAIHRFETPDGERACLLLADALATDLIATATRLEGIRVRPAAGAEAGEGYRVTGEVRAVGAKLRVTVRLQEAAGGAAIWADQVEHPRDDPPSLSEEELLTLAARLNRHVARHSLSLARGKPVDALSARELTLIGRDHHGRSTEADTVLAKERFSRAIAADPDYAQAYAWQSYTVQRAITHGWGSPGGQEARDESLRLARRAVQLDPASPLCLARLAFALVLHQRWEEAMDAARSALTSGRPAFAFARNTCCEVLIAAGHPEEAVAAAQGALAIDPLPPPTTHALLGRALLLAGKVEEALPPLRWCAAQLPDYAVAYDTLVVAAVESGRIPEALAAWRELLRLQPNWAPRNHTGFWFFRRPEDVERFQAAHRRLAGLGGSVSDGAVASVEDPTSSTDIVRSLPESPRYGFEAAKGSAGSRKGTLVVDVPQVSPDSSAAHAAPVLASDLMAELVRYEELCVVPGPHDEAKGDFAVKGNIRSVGENIRAVIRLDDLATGTTFWAGRLEWMVAAATNPPVESIAALTSEMDLEIWRQSLRRARQKPAEALTARDLTLLGRESYERSTEAETTAARQLFVRASALDPGYAAAHALHAFALARVATHGWNSMSRAEAVEQAVRLARRAVELEPESPLALSSLSFSFALQDHWD